MNRLFIVSVNRSEFGENRRRRDFLHLRGRYNAAAGLSWGLSSTLAPAITALYFSVHLGNWWPLGTGLTALLGGAMMMDLRRHVSASADGRVEVAAS